MALSSTSSGWMYVDLILTKPSVLTVELSPIPSDDDDEDDETMQTQNVLHTESNKISLDIQTNASSLTTSTVPTLQSVTISDKKNEKVADDVAVELMLNKQQTPSHNGTITEGKYRSGAKFGIMLGAKQTANPKQSFSVLEDDNKHLDDEDDDAETEESSTFSANKEEHGFIEPAEVTKDGQVTDIGNDYQTFHKETEGDDALDLALDDNTSEEETEEKGNVRMHFKGSSTAGEIHYQLPKQNQTKGQWM